MSTVFKYIIHGAGAIGSALGGAMAKAGLDVTLICRKNHGEAIKKQQGLLMHTLNGKMLQPIKIDDEIKRDSITKNTVIFQTMKATDTLSSLEDLKVCDAQSTPIICWQNGVENELIISSVFNRVFGGVVRFTATMMTPGTVSFAGTGKLIIGPYPQGMNSFTDKLVTDLLLTGFTVLKSDNIMQDKWLKLLVNLISIIKPMTIKSKDELEKRIELCRRVLEEGIEVLSRSGIKACSTNQTEDSPETMLTNFSETLNLAEGVGQKMDLKNSTWQSLAKKNKVLECDLYTGTVIDLGIKSGIPTPYNQAILHFLHTIAEEELGPESIAIDNILEKIDEIKIKTN